MALITNMDNTVTITARRGETRIEHTLNEKDSSPYAYCTVLSACGWEDIKINGEEWIGKRQVVDTTNKN